ncbi:hypothetical protein B7R54_02965 [Subtercola boreus]|uniref:Uncharacterized protein n=1 Tax=Subtercola boreus TaxID=120213 RepID=A0A3E0VF70_9MICO|nr:hypothetical protein [Subtercola boreus]RFA08299.1 hypothetical protein B7R54_02965 [Subtercola boreus]TQL54801.1 hypothetical protein FB464_2347 [Subtercola boreus]
MTLRAHTSLSGFGRRALGALAVLGAFAFVGGVTAAPANAVPLDFVVSSGDPDFGFQKTGTVQTRTFALLNSGDDDITIEAPTLRTLSAPFAASAISFTNTTVIAPTGHATFTVTYTVPAVGMPSDVPVVLFATDQVTGDMRLLTLRFKGTPTATDPAHFTATTSGGGTSADFGTVSVGSFAAKDVTLTVDGVLPIRFSTDNITIVDSAGNPLPSVKVTASSFGTAGAVTNPGVTAAFELTYSPLAAGSFTGSARVSGFAVSTGSARVSESAVSGSVETSAITVVVPLSGSAAAITPTTPPTTAPASPGATVTPLPTVTGTTASTAAVVAPRPGTGTGSLAETGAPVAGIVGLGAMVGLLGFGALAGLTVTRRRRANNA